MAEQVLLNTPHVLSALSPANSRYSRPRRRPLHASGRLLRLAAEGDLVAPWRCSCTSRTLAKHFSENHLCGAKELFASPRKFFRIPPPLSIETLRKSAENPVFSARVSFFLPKITFFHPRSAILHGSRLASSFSRRSTIDRSCIARRLDVRLTNGRRRMPSLVVGGGVRARKPPSAPSSAC